MMTMFWTLLAIGAVGAATFGCISRVLARSAAAARSVRRVPVESSPAAHFRRGANPGSTTTPG
jgi:hypothetical protein